ncbi:MAG: hypothetical protein DMG74_22040 [Acidobacteria bacterium]|nr:MAG: hypothetical protein DMG74_22040 [Acidobacteriota bacterium]
MINPQDGHILWDPKPAICGVSPIKRTDALKFLNERATNLGSLRKREQNGRKMGSIDEPPQDGHILWDPKPAICGVSPIKRTDALKFLNERATNLGSLRKREQNGRKMGSIDEPSFYQLRRGPSRKA